MPTNANTFNSRVTSEALEAKFRQVFPSQGGAELGQDLFASGVLQPVIDFSSVAEGSFLPVNLQTAWDFSTAAYQVNNATTTVANNPGFWLVDLICTTDIDAPSVPGVRGQVKINDGATVKNIWGISAQVGPNPDRPQVAVEGKFVVFLRSGDSLQAQSNGTNCSIDIWTRQIATVNGTLVNPLGFTFS